MLAVIGLVASSPVFAAMTFQQFMDQQLSPLKGKTNFGVVIMSAQDGHVIYAANPNLPLVPASNEKILTTVTALAILGADFQFTTTLAKSGGDLVIIGDGDPGFGDPSLCETRPVTDIFDEWAKALSATGIKEISGKLILDDTIFDRQFVHPNWPADQVNRWYTAPVAGLNFNDNCLDLFVQYDTDKKPHLLTSPATQFFVIEPQWIPAKGTSTTIWPIWESPQKLKAKIRLGSRGTGPVNITVNDPPLYFAAVCKERLQANGITIKGPIAFQRIRKSDGSFPDNLTIIARHKTPIMEAVTRANTNSQNFFAECIFKRLGYQSAKTHASFSAGTWTTGQLAVKEFLQDRLKVSLDNIFIDDGSGLSKNNRVSAEIIAKLLYFAQQQLWGERFRSSLAVAGGKDGTLRKRMRRTAAAGRVYAKTGYIAGSSALSGYILDNENKPKIIFSMIFNFPGASGKLWQIKSIEDKICIVLAQLLANQPITTPKNTEPEIYTPGQTEE